MGAELFHAVGQSDRHDEAVWNCFGDVSSNAHSYATV
jgi:hypothetical protein